MKKIFSKGRLVSFSLHKKLLLKMKLTLFFAIVITTGLSATTSYSQDKKLTIDLENATIKELLKEIKKQSDFSFWYSNDELNDNKTITLSVKDQRIDKILELALKDQHLDYEIKDKLILIFKGVTAKNQSERAQLKKVSGTITDVSTGEVLVGVSIIVEGSTKGVISDMEGKFSIEVPENTVLNFSYVGYLNERVEVGAQTTMTIKLTPDITKLDEVVVIGYGTVQKKNVLGAVDQIQSGSIEDKPVSNLMQALQGTSANLIIQQTNSEPGSNININIRGVSTMGNNTPLVVIDGLVGGDLTLLNPADIESVSVLKDAGSAAIYGSRSSNGVLLITTKKGKQNLHAQVTVNTQTGYQIPHILYEPVKGFENAILRNQALINSGSAPIYSAEAIRTMQERGDSEWFLKSILQNSLQQNYNFSISSGKESTTYMISGGYLKQESNLVGQDFGLQRFNFRMNMINEYGRLKLTTIMAYAHAINKTPTISTSTLIVDAGRTPTYYNYALKDSSGRYLINDVLSQFNPLGILENGGTKTFDKDNFTGNVNAELTLLKGLKLKGVAGGEFLSNHSLLLVKKVDYYASATATQVSSSYGADRNTQDENEKSIFLNSQVILDFSKAIGESHHITALIGVSNESYTSHKNGLFEKLTDPDLNTPVTGTVIETGSYTTPQRTVESSLNSLFGRAGYNFREKYLLEVSFRYDGSSKFVKTNRWGFFPSISAVWRISDESFMSSYKDKIGDIKLRSSYGVLGNQNIDDYKYQTTYNVYTNAYGFNNTAVAGTGFTFANTNLTWEKSSNFNIGFDASYFKNRLSVSADYFNKLTSNILIPPAVPGTYGVGKEGAPYNAGKMRNQGWEVSVTYRTVGKLFSHSVSLNIGDTWNKVVYFTGGQQIKSSDEMQRILQEGQAFNSYLGFKRDGYFQNMDEVKNGAKPLGANVSPGDIRYKDKNGDGVIDDNDRSILGNAFPRYTFGLRYELGWKGFDFNMFIQGVGKRSMFLRGELIEPFHANYSYVMYKHQLDFWTPINPGAKYPRLSAPNSASNVNNFRQSSDLYILNAAYARLKNVQLGYTVPVSVSRKIGMEKMRVYVTAQNLLTVSKCSFIDPESSEFDNNLNNSGANSGRNYPTPIYYGFGLDINF